MNRTMRTVKGLLLGVLSMGFSTVIAACYGSQDVEDDYSPSPGPTAYPFAKGHVTDVDSGAAVKGIQVICDNSQSGLTDEQGLYEVKTTSFPEEGTQVACIFQDADRNVDGDYSSEEESFTYTEGSVAELDVVLSPSPSYRP